MNKGCRDDDASAKLLEKHKDEVQLVGHPPLKEDRAKDT